MLSLAIKFFGNCYRKNIDTGKFESIIWNIRKKRCIEFWRRVLQWSSEKWSGSSSTNISDSEYSPDFVLIGGSTWYSAKWFGNSYTNTSNRKCKLHRKKIHDFSKLWFRVIMNLFCISEAGNMKYKRRRVNAFLFPSFRTWFGISFENDA